MGEYYVQDQGLEIAFENQVDAQVSAQNLREQITCIIKGIIIV